MMDYSWMVVVAVNDRTELIAKGVPKEVADRMSHQEVIEKLKELGHTWKKPKSA